MKCKYCGKYSVPERTDKMYCDIDCKQAYFRKQSEKNNTDIYIYYRELYNRYKNTKAYAPIFEEFKTLYKDCKSKQLDDEEIIRILTKFEKDVKSKYTVKRGRPKKNKNV